MALDAIVRKGVSLADKITKGLQVPVVFEAWISDDTYAKRIYAPPITLLAIVEYGVFMRNVGAGRQIQASAHVTFTTPLTANGSPGRREPIDTRDRFTLPGGNVQTIADIKGFLDSQTQLPYVAEVWLGVVG